jgi:putative hydrolase of the HAD superfamily
MTFPTPQTRLSRLLRPIRAVPTGAQPRLPSLNGVRAVALDVYGTLLCSAAGDIGTTADPAPRLVATALRSCGLTCRHPSCGEAALARLALEIRADHARRRKQGIDAPEVDIRRVWSRVLRSLAARGLLTGPIDRETVEAVAVEYEGRANPVWPMPGVTAALRALRRRGLILAIVSNAQFYTPLQLAALIGIDWFDAKCCAWSWKLGVAKPSPELLRHTLRSLASRHGLAPSAVLCVGNDRLNDLAPAARLGCRTALFAGDARSLRRRPGDPRCRGVRPQAVLTHWSQLPPLIGTFSLDR